MKLFKEKYQIIICILAVGVVGGFVLFRFMPLQKRKKAIELTKAAQQLAIVKSELEKQQLPVVTGQLLSLQKKIGNYDLKVPKDRDLGVFLQKVTELMDAQNLKEQLIQPGREIKTEKINCIPINMQCKGNVKQLFEFFKLLQKLDRMIRIEKIKLVNEKDFNGQVSMFTKAFIYYRSDSEQG